MDATTSTPTSRTLRSATSPTKSPPLSELTGKTSKTKGSSTGSRKRKVAEEDDNNSGTSSDDDGQSEQSVKRKKTVDKTDIEFNREERKYVKMKVRCGDNISSPCWSSKLCQIASLTKEGIDLMKKKKCKI